jgi:hypothetical protein
MQAIDHIMIGSKRDQKYQFGNSSCLSIWLFQGFFVVCLFKKFTWLLKNKLICNSPYVDIASIFNVMHYHMNTYNYCCSHTCQLNNTLNCSRFKTNYSGFTNRSSNGSAKKKERQGETQFTTKTEVSPPLNAEFYFIFESPQVKITIYILCSVFTFSYRAM